MPMKASRPQSAPGCEAWPGVLRFPGLICRQHQGAPLGRFFCSGHLGFWGPERMFPGLETWIICRLAIVCCHSEWTSAGALAGPVPWSCLPSRNTCVFYKSTLTDPAIACSSCEQDPLHSILLSGRSPCFTARRLLRLLSARSCWPCIGTIAQRLKLSSLVGLSAGGFDAGGGCARYGC